jgi:hypothetical protein
MRSLSELQRRFAGAIVFGDAGAVAGLGIVGGAIDAASRVAIYRNNVFGNYRRALSATYPVLRRLVGGPFFDAAADAFVRAYPSTVGDLNRYGGDLPHFLERYAPAQSLPYLADVARLEWAIDQARIAGDAEPFDLGALRSVPAHAQGKLRFVLHPSARLVVSPYPILHIWRTNQPGANGDERIDLGEGGDRLLIRRTAGEIAVESLTAGELVLLGALGGGAILDEAARRASAAEASFDLSAALQKHVSAHVIAGFRAPAAHARGRRR